ncbi:MAG: hypothetical protein IPO06_19700 [Leptospiraceae bacterium]|nr:hypothetical protein [Leptospiraceae bacterium]
MLNLLQEFKNIIKKYWKRERIDCAVCGGMANIQSRSKDIQRRLQANG